MFSSGVIVGQTAFFNSLITGANGYNIQVSRSSYTGMTFILRLQCRIQVLMKKHPWKNRRSCHSQRVMNGIEHWKYTMPSARSIFNEHFEIKRASQDEPRYNQMYHCCMSPIADYSVHRSSSCGVPSIGVFFWNTRNTGFSFKRNQNVRRRD